jgi:hypothetical protein
MGLGDFLQNILGSRNTFSAQPMQMGQIDYSKQMDEAQKNAIAGMGASANAANMNQALAQQLMAQASGEGPSLAQMQLQQASDQNLKNQAGLIASQRGMNPNQVARAVAMQGASTGQDLANKSAQLRLQEQLEKQRLLQSGLLGQQQIGGNLYGTTGQLQQGQNDQNLRNYWNSKQIEADVAKQNTAGANALTSGLLGAGASILAGPAGGALFGGGGMSSGFQMPSMGSAFKMAGNSGGFQSNPLGVNTSFSSSLNPADFNQYAEGGVIGDDATPADYNGAPEMRRVAVSPGEAVVNPDGKVMKVPGKAKVPGDSPKNDTVIADLRQDSIVVPRSKSGDKEKIIEFMKHVKEASKKKSDLQELMDTHNDIKQKLEDLKYKMGKYRPK